jgi:integrase
MTDSNVRKLIARLGQAAKLGFPVHPHQLRHACGYALVKAGHDTGASSSGSDTGTSRTPFVTRRSPTHRSKNSGATDSLPLSHNGGVLNRGRMSVDA